MLTHDNSERRVLQCSDLEEVPEDGVRLPEKSVETAVALAVLEYNLGPRGFERALLEMNMEAGTHHESQVKKATQYRLARSSALESPKVAHKQRKMEAVASEQKRLQQEGPTYAAGLF